ncbi:MAG: A/G-specific adenine glycosylase [Gemmatimonadales bacterium]
MNRTPWSGHALGEIRAALLRHYDRHRRALPWRGESDPYRVLVSEVMLQQTRVETVTLRYASWLDRFPDVSSLAAASEDEVLKAWEGLGYYRRARNLHQAAKLVRERPERSIPSTYAGLRELPGLGDYTAGAVASIAFGEPVAAVDGNVRRVAARLLDEPSPSPARLRAVASALLDPSRPGDWNQAMMDLGATICVPREPRCDTCPLARWCAARAAGTQRERPERAPRRPPRTATIALAVLHSEGRVLLERRPRGGLLGGMWALPEREIPVSSRAAAVAVELAVERELEVIGEPGALAEHAHAFTHLRATYVPVVVEVRRRETAEPDPSLACWVEPHLPTSRALPTAQKRVLAAFLRSSATMATRSGCAETASDARAAGRRLVDRADGAFA